MSSSQSSFPELPTLETCEAAILCARIFSPQSSTNFTRNPLFAALFSLVLAAVIDYGETLATCRKIDQHANHILLTSLTDLEGPVLEWLEESKARSSRGKGRRYGIPE